MKKILAGLIGSLLFFSTHAQIFQFRGPARDGKFEEVGLLKAWPAEGPELLLEIDSIGKGYSSVISDGEFIYVSGMKDTMDYLTCIDFSGIKRWQVPYGESWKKSFPDTRSTPTIEDDRIYIVSGIGELVCLNKTDGSIIWKQNVDRDFEADWHIWGVSESPLIVGDLAICTPGGTKTSVVAFDKFSGELKWETASVGGQRAYASATTFDLDGKQYILAETATNLMVIDPANGSVKMTYQYYNHDKWSDQPGLIWTNIPLIKGDEIFLSMGYDYPAKMIKVNADRTGFEELYTDTIFDNHHHGLIELDGYIYGSNWENNRKGNWLCKNWKTGEITYNEQWNTKGALIYADSMLYVYEEQRGTVALVKPNPEKFDVVSTFRFEKGAGPHWAHPFINDGKLFLRHGDVLQVYNLRE
ncbi:outer membrane protein assembly factor BamB family protein [Mangrovibacterium diazotrophicum]|uniref:Putative pyrroloquinoline-quinone binding quinoprotein n=1 Tax=Mangrovibacterium diazotrophicum TaxID=1261403 RepID=A0A419W3B0_9BACT|nr:PQQ-binding-like beta-propeller repeat protein [Mangrovibacterium diazotrophicum]RKD89962.1 putative pyrroloquinoline-quinone binding quinoprotein [Mangrovibacterium diazotrophicum]